LLEHHLRNDLLEEHLVAERVERKQEQWSIEIEEVELEQPRDQGVVKLALVLIVLLVILISGKFLVELAEYNYNDGVDYDYCIFFDLLADGESSLELLVDLDVVEDHSSQDDPQKKVTEALEPISVFK